MQGASRITVAAGGLLVAAAWAAGVFDLFGRNHAVTDILAEVVAAFVVVLAWRYRRDRLAIAALVIAAANLLVRTKLIAEPIGPATAALALVIAIVLGSVALARDRPLWGIVGFAWIVLVTAGIWFASFGVRLAGEDLISWLSRPVVIPAAFITAGIVVLAVSIARRRAFEGSLIVVITACAAALVRWRGPHTATLLFTAAELALLIGLFEDSYRLAFHDQLTGLPGRRALDEAMSGLGGTFTIAMVDIDHFKRFNDRHGHDAGDQVLRMVADELAGTGCGGRAHRYGGEEFTILYPTSAVVDLRDELDALRTAIADRRFALRAPDRPRSKPDRPKKGSQPTRRVTVTVSIGAANSNPRRKTADAVLQAADRALYRAKRAGRNRVVAAGDRLPKSR